MNETEWLTGRSPNFLFDYVCRRSSARKARLFAVACARRVPELLADDRCRQVIELSEMYADGLVPYSQLKGLFPDNAHPNTSELNAAWWCTRLGKVQAPQLVASFASAVVAVHRNHDFGRELAAQAEIVRDIFRNPFHPVAFDPRWRTADAVGLARAIYEDRAFERMPLLEDALMDAGCGDEQVIGHCRGGGQHVRGCWVVDLVLGKE